MAAVINAPPETDHQAARDRRDLKPLPIKLATRKPIPRVVSPLVGYVDTAGVPPGGQQVRVARRLQGHRVHEMEETSGRPRPRPARYRRLYVTSPGTLERAQQVGVLRVSLDWVGAVVESHHASPGVPGAPCQRGVMSDVLRVRRHPVEEDAGHLVPADVPAH